MSFMMPINRFVRIILPLVFMVFFITSCDFFSPATPLENGYYFVTIDTSNRYIYREMGDHREEVISATIVASQKTKNYYFVLRQPRVDYAVETEHGRALNSKFLNQCEFYILDFTHAKLSGPLSVEEFRSLSKATGECDPCLFKHTITNEVGYCTSQKDYQDLFGK